MKIFTSKRRVVAGIALILLALFLIRPGASRLKSRIIRSISSGVGRSVDIGSVHLRLLPRPGFDLENLVVYDDPAFGAEPMLRASEVTADLRLTSLLRGRIEIARLDLTEPSLNLVRGETGRWNLEALLERTAHTPLAPTAKAKSEPRPAFPYIAATSARINFKSGSEKKPYALTGANFSLWQDTENEWGVRLKAQPFRGDMNLNDTGLLQVNGTWQRADALRDTPVQFNMEWNRAQLGQLTKFFTGSDRGWRGGVQVDVTLEGTPAKLQVASNISVQDFRRYDIENGEALRLAVHCDGQYSSTDRTFHEVDCNAPVGKGLITMKGGMGLPGNGNYSLALTARNVPASAAMALVERSKKNLADDLTASGMIHGNLLIEKKAATAPKLRFEGRGDISDFHLMSATYKAEIGPETIPFVLTDGDSGGSAAEKRQTIRKSATGTPAPAGSHIEFGPFPIAAGRTGAATVRAWANRSGYNISIVGEAQVENTLRVARMLGLPALQTSAEGTAQVDLQIGGAWAGGGYGSPLGFSVAQVNGDAKLHNLHIAVHGVSEPVEISSADVQVAPDEVRVTKLIAKAADAVWTGSLEMPRGCGTPSACQVRFVLNGNQISLTALSEWVNPSPKQRPWYRILDSNAEAGPTFLGSLRASGRVSAESLQVQNLVANHVSANVKLDGGNLQVTDLNADFLGGKHSGEWGADFSAKPAVCDGSGSLSGISLARVADAMYDQWIAGSANASYEVKGSCAHFWQSAEGMLQFDARNSVLQRISLGEDGAPLEVTRFAGRALMHAGNFEIKDAKLDSLERKFLLSGTVSLKRELDLKLTGVPNGATLAGYAISGTLAAPRMIPSSNAETQARLKSEPPK